MKMPNPLIHRFCAFDTNVAFFFWGDIEGAYKAAGYAESTCRRYEELFSRTIPESDVGRINASAGDWVKVDPNTLDLIIAAIHYCSESGGIFDITIAPLVFKWNFRTRQIPSDADLQEALSFVDWTDIEVDNVAGKVRLCRSGMMIDLGGIAKGWMADAIVGDIMDAGLGICGMIANLGGNVAVAGSKAKDTPFKIGIKSPFEPSKNLAIIALQSGSAVTSGIYERSFTTGGVCFHHILDPKTGYPAKTDLLSATLVCERSLDAEGFSTTVLALGKERGVSFVRDHPEIEHACLVCDDGELLLL